MPYKFFIVYFNNVGELNELRRPIEIYKRFVDSLGNTRIIGSNFNKYWEGAPPHNPHIEIRMNLRTRTRLNNMVTRIQRIGTDLIQSHLIERCDSRLRDWPEPAFVVKAHETATKCAVAFKERLDIETRTYETLMANPDDFMWKFVVALLRQAGFRPNIIWGILRTPIPAETNDLASACSNILRQSINSQEPTADFVERFVHCFFNCTLSNESILLSYLQVSSIWQSLASSWQTT